MPEEVPGHPVEGLATAHRIVAATAVDVHVDEPGRDERTAGRRRPAKRR